VDATSEFATFLTSLTHHAPPTFPTPTPSHRPPFQTCVPAGSSHVDATSEFAAVVTHRLGRLRLLMAAEIDAQQPGGEPGPEGGAPYVEMKTYS
jgi:hypothetical protein